MCSQFESEYLSLATVSPLVTCAWPAGKFTNDENGTSPHLDMLTNAQSVAANLRIMASISGHNEAEDAELMHHRHTTAITHETMAIGHYNYYYGDKPGEEADDDDDGERDTRSILQLYPRYYHEPTQSDTHCLQQLSILSNSSLLDVQMPYTQVATELAVDVAAYKKSESEQTEDKRKERDRTERVGGKGCRGGNGPLSKEQQRRNACIRERIRMGDMNRAFETLRERLPSIKQPGKRVSKIEALRMTIKYIRELKSMLDEIH